MDRLRDAGFVLAAGRMKAAGFQRLDRIAHHHRCAGELEHLEVVEVVADRHHLLGRNAESARAAGKGVQGQLWPATLMSMGWYQEPSGKIWWTLLAGN